MAEVKAQDDLLAVVREFQDAQQLEVVREEQLRQHIAVLTVDDPHSLVNAFVVVQASDALTVDQVREAVLEADIEANRTELILPNDATRLYSELRRQGPIGVSRIATLSEFLDGYLRPQSICDQLLRPPKTSAERSRLLDQSDYVQQSARSERSQTHIEGSLEYLYGQWAKGLSPRFAVVLAPAGFGKSKMAHILAARLAANYEQSRADMHPPLPFLIPFGEYRRGSSSFDGLILSALSTYGRALLHPAAFRLLIRLGRVLFIVDGFDEMMEANPETARDNIRDFVSEAGTSSRVLLTSRSTFFRTSADVEAAFQSHVLTEEDIEVLELEPFDKEQAEVYLSKRLPEGSARTLSRARQFLQEPSTLDLLSSPLFISEFANTVEQRGFSIDDVRSKGMYGYLVGCAYERERERQRHDFTDGEQEGFLECMSFDMLKTNEVGYTRDDLEYFADEAFDSSERAAQWRLLGSHHFLTDLPGTRLISMRHQLWREYFQGLALARRIAEGSPAADDVLSERELPEGVLRHAGDELGSVKLVRLASQFGSAASNTLAKNLVKAALVSGSDRRSLMNVVKALGGLTGRALDGLVFRDLDLRAVDMTGATFEGTFFDRCRLTGVIFNGALLRSTTFVQCELDRNLLTGRLTSLTIDGTPLYGQQEVSAYLREPTTEKDAAEDATDDRAWVRGVLKDRMERFVEGHLEQRYVRTQISWRNFVSGAPTELSDYIRTRVYRAMRSEQLIVDVDAVSRGGQHPLGLGNANDVRREFIDFVVNDQEGPMVSATIERLLQSAGRQRRN
jgi:hypothetical protein